MKAFIIYCSPAGSTANIARELESSLKKQPGVFEEVKLYDLGELAIVSDRESIAPLLERIKDAGSELFIALGSLVYVGHPLPQISTFLETLPEGKGCWFFSFVSWGAVSSGVALSDLGGAARGKGYRIPGACSLPAPHSQMWRNPNPLGEGLPSRADRERFDQGAKEMGSRISTGRELTVLSLLDHPDRDVRDTFGKIDLWKAAGEMTRRRVKIEREEACTRCGHCAEVCPTGAISFDPYPVFGERCIYCFNCVRLCPTNAIAADLSSKMGWLRQESESAEMKRNQSDFLSKCSATKIVEKRG